MNLRRLNYILIRGDADTWDSWLHGRMGRFVLGLFAPFIVLTPEGGAVAVATLLTGAAGVDVHYSRLYLVFCGLFSLLIVAYIARLFFAQPGALQVSAHAPARVSAGETIVVTTELYNPGSKPLYALRIQGPFLPWDGKWLVRRPSVDVLQPGERVRVESQLILSERGQRPIGRFAAASVRPIGLVRGPQVRSLPVRIIVVPRTVRLLGLPPPPLVPADHAEFSRGRAEGADFELAGVRPYRPGDRLRDLHARSWARLGEPMVRTFRRTARREAAIVFDASMGKVHEPTFEAAVSLTASLVRWAVGEGARVRLLIVADRCREVVVGAQVAPVDIALDALAAVQPVDQPPPDANARAATIAVRDGTVSVHAERVDAVAVPFARYIFLMQPKSRQPLPNQAIRVVTPADLAGDTWGVV